MAGGWMGWRRFEGVLRLGLGKEGATICLRGVVVAPEVEGTTGGGTGRRDFGFAKLSSMRVSLRDDPCCDVEAIRSGGGAGLSSFFCFTAAAGLSNGRCPLNKGIGNTRLFSLPCLGGRFDARVSVRPEATSGSCTMEGDHRLWLTEYFKEYSTYHSFTTQTLRTISKR